MRSLRGGLGPATRAKRLSPEWRDATVACFRVRGKDYGSSVPRAARRGAQESSHALFFARRSAERHGMRLEPSRRIERRICRHFLKRKGQSQRDLFCGSFRRSFRKLNFFLGNGCVNYTENFGKCPLDHWQNDNYNKAQKYSPNIRINRDGIKTWVNRTKTFKIPKGRHSQFFIYFFVFLQLIMNW